MDEEFEVQIKAWYKSLTVWSIVLYVAAMFIIEFAPVARENLPPSSHLWLTALEGAALLYLRIFHTRQPVTVRAAIKPMIPDQTIVRNNPPAAVREEPLMTTTWRFKKQA